MTIERLIERAPSDVSDFTPNEVGLLDFESDPLLDVRLRGYRFMDRSVDAIIKIERIKGRELAKMNKLGHNFSYADVTTYFVYSDTQAPILGKKDLGEDLSGYIWQINLPWINLDERPKLLGESDGSEEDRRRVFELEMAYGGYSHLLQSPKRLHIFIMQDATKFEGPGPNEGRPCLINLMRARQIPEERFTLGVPTVSGSYGSGKRSR